MIKGYVYVIEDELGRTKIGKTTSPVARIQSISTASGLSIVKTYVTTPLALYGDLELHLHKVFAEYRGIGEWFNVPFADVVDYIKDDNLSYYNNVKPLISYIALSKRIVTMRSIRNKLFTSSEKQLLFSIFMYHNVKSKSIIGNNGKPETQSNLCESVGWSNGHFIATMDCLINKKVIQKIVNGKSVYYKFV